VQPLAWQAVLEEQAGVMTRAQALDGGLTTDAWQWRLGRDWQAPAAGVAVATPGRSPTRS
jgi:hypothetical protein